MLSTYIVYPERLYDLTLVTDDFIVYSSDFWDRDPAYMSKLAQRTHEFQSANQELGQFIITGIRDRDFVNMTEFEIVRQHFESAARSYNYYLNRYEETIVHAPVVYAEHRIDMFMDRYLLLSQIYSDLINTINSMADLTRDVTLTWDEVRKMKSIYSAYIEDESIRKALVASVFTSNEFAKQMGSLQQFFDEIATISMDAVSKLDIYKQSHLELWNAMVGENTLRQFYQALHDDLSNTSSQTNPTILSVFSEFVGRNESWLLNNWDELSLYLNADFPDLNQTSGFAEVANDLIGSIQTIDFSDIIGLVDDQYFSLIQEIHDYMQRFLKGYTIDEAFYK